MSEPEEVWPADGEAPKCHFTTMKLECGDDIGCSVEFWECPYCGHTKLASVSYRDGY